MSHLCPSRSLFLIDTCALKQCLSTTKYANKIVCPATATAPVLPHSAAGLTVFYLLLSV